LCFYGLLYAGLKYLGKQLPGLMVEERTDSVLITPTGDPTFLHSDYRQHPVFDYLKSLNKPITINSSNWKTNALGSGWTWGDYLSYYSAERSPMPIYGNYIKWIQQKTVETENGKKDTAVLIITEPEINWPMTFVPEKGRSFNIYRPRTENTYTVTEGREMKAELEVPFVTNGIQSTLELLKDTLQKQITVTTTTLLQPNKGMPQRPRWADGSGLSRYNLFTPDDLVWLLLKMKDEFGMDRLKTLFETGNTGTLRNYYKEEAGFIYAKTGTLSGVVALSGYLYTNKNNLLVFSFLVNNHNTSSTAVRRAVEKYIKGLKAKY